MINLEYLSKKLPAFGYELQENPEVNVFIKRLLQLLTSSPLKFRKNELPSFWKKLREGGLAPLRT